MNPVDPERPDAVSQPVPRQEIPWESFAASQAAMKNAARSPVCKAYFALMDCNDRDPRDEVLLFSIVGSYRPAARFLALAI
jgi:hypothetical protein